MSIEKFKNLGLDKLIPTIYDFGGMTEQETWCKFAQKINLIIEHFNYLDKKFDNQKELVDEKLTYLLGEGMSEQVAKKILELINDGTLKELINTELLGEINTKVDTFKTEVTEEVETFKSEVNSQLDTNKNELQDQINNLVLESGGDSNLEVVQARDGFSTLNDRITLCENKVLYDDYFINSNFDLTNASTINLKTIFLNKTFKKDMIIKSIKVKIETASSNSGTISFALYKLTDNVLTFIENIGDFDAKTSNTEYEFRINKKITQDCIIAIYGNNANIGFVQGDYSNEFNFSGQYTLGSASDKFPVTLNISSWGSNAFFKVKITTINSTIDDILDEILMIENSSVNIGNVLTVGASGCNFTDLQDAINSIEDDTETNRYVIIAMPGIYKRFYSYSTKTTTSRGRGVARYISVIGIDKYSCIIKDKISGTFESNGVLRNFHIITTDETVSSDTNEFHDSLSGYGLHIDQAGFSECIVEDCIIESYKHCAIGSGTKSNQTIKLIRNKLISHKTGESGLFYHNNHWQVTNNKNQNLYLEGNYCYADSGYGIYLNDTLVGQTQYPSLVNVTMLNNIVGSGDKGYGDNAIRKQEINGDYISGTNFKLEYGFGNNASLLNS